MEKQWQPPKHWHDFEAMCHLLYVADLKPTQHYLYGRSGQAQHGVDIALRTDAVLWTGIQCKLKTELKKSTLSEQELIDEHNKSRQFNGGLERLIIATTSPRDTLVQDRARVISESWQRGHPVEIAFWDDIEELLNRHPSIANRFYPESFAPINSLNVDDEGGLNIALLAADWQARLGVLFSHAIFKAHTSGAAADLMMIVSELVDNLFHKGKGRAERVHVSLSNQVLTVTDDGVPFHILDAEVELKPEMRGLVAMRRLLGKQPPLLRHQYVKARPNVTRLNTNRFEILPSTGEQVLRCSASGPANYILNRDAASAFVRALHIPDECNGFTLNLYATTDFLNFSAASQLVGELVSRLNGRQLRVKLSQDCVGFADALRYETDRYPSVIVEFV